MEFDEKKDSVDLQKAIVRTVAYFDMFDFPMTDFEIWQLLGEKCNFIEVRNILNLMSLRAEGEAISVSGIEPGLLRRSAPRNDSAVLETKNGFYFLKGRESIIRTRLDRYNFTDRKFKRALRVVKIYRLIPWVKMVAVSNIIGAHNLKDESDIDIFIIAEKGKIWLTRFFCAGIAKILGLRPSEKNSRDKICLNFYISEEEMNLKKFMLDDKDIYFVYWLANLITIYDKDGAYKKFIQANGWLKNYLPNWQEAKMVSRRTVKKSGKLFFYFLFNFIFGSLEGMFKKIQLRMLPLKIKELINKDTRVVINDKVLKLHVNDRREEYRKNYELRAKNYE